MNVNYFISKRLIGAKENKNAFSRPIIRISIIAIALSVAIMIISLSVLLGFKKEIVKKVSAFSSHIQIKPVNSSNMDLPLEITDELIDSISKYNQILDIDSVIYDFGLIKTSDEFLSVNVKGVNFNSYNWDIFNNAFSSPLEGNVLDSDSSILVSSVISRKLKLKIGDAVIISFFSNEYNRIQIRKFYVCGIYNTSMSEFDSKFTFVSLNKLRQLKNWKDSEVELLELQISDLSYLDDTILTTQLYFSVNDYYQDNKEKKKNENLIQNLDLLGIDYKDHSEYKLSLNQPRYYAPVNDVISIKELYPTIFAWLDLLDVNLTLIIVLMLIVAFINIISSIFILILEKTRLIGILKSLGMANWNIRKIFMYNTTYLVLRGLLWGNLIAFILLFIQYYFHIITLDEETYYMKNIPISFDILPILFLNIGTLIVCFIMTILPSVIITKISPIKSIRFE